MYVKKALKSYAKKVGQRKFANVPAVSICGSLVTEIGMCGRVACVWDIFGRKHTVHSLTERDSIKLLASLLIN